MKAKIYLILIWIHFVDWEMNKYELLGPEEIDVPAHKVSL
jgi:hypothetical protein